MLTESQEPNGQHRHEDRQNMDKEERKENQD